MEPKRSFGVVVAGVLLLFASGNVYADTKCSKHKGCNGELKEVLKTGKEASKTLLKTLGGNMKKHMKAGGAVEALSFCSVNAAGLTAEVSAKFGEKVDVKRITLKPRNPANMAEGSEKKILEALDTLKSNGVKMPRYLLQKVESGYKYYKPLVINKRVCLKCHGDSIDKDLAAEIKKRYPTDMATGYRMGDLRGAIVVTIER